MTTNDKLFSLEELATLQTTCRSDVALNRALAKQLADTMRENERLRKMLDKCWTGEWFPGNEDFSDALYPNKDSND